MTDFGKEHARLRKQTDAAIAAFVLTEIETARTFVSMAKTVPRTSEEHARYLGHVKKALEEVSKRMWTLKMGHAQFDRMTSEAELLRFEMDALTADQQDG